MFLSWIDTGPKNKVLRYVVYYPTLLLLGVAAIALLMVVPEILAYVFGTLCILWVVVWPVAKIYEWLMGKKIL